MGPRQEVGLRQLRSEHRSVSDGRDVAIQEGEPLHDFPNERGCLLRHWLLQQARLADASLDAKRARVDEPAEHQLHAMSLGQLERHFRQLLPAGEASMGGAELAFWE